MCNRKCLSISNLFYIIFTSYGTTICTQIIASNYLKPNGTFITVDFHSILLTFDDKFEIYYFSFPILKTVIQQKSIHSHHNLCQISDYGTMIFKV